MAIINLRDYYPFYTSDYFMEGKRTIASTLSAKSRFRGFS